MKRARANDKLILELRDNKRLKLHLRENVRSFSINLLRYFCNRFAKSRYKL
jgi:hypothetical protein